MPQENQTDWIEHDGGPMPVPADTLVLTRRPHATDRFPKFAGWWNGDGSEDDSNWLLSAGEHRIIAYRVVQA